MSMGQQRGQLWALFSFKGRIARAGYWLYSIPVLLVMVPTYFYLLGDTTSTLGNLLSLLTMVFVWWASLALNIKRLHDRNKPAYWVLLTVMPLIGPIFTFVELGCLRGTTGTNRYGEDPLGGKTAKPDHPDDNDTYTMEG